MKTSSAIEAIGAPITGRENSGRLGLTPVGNGAFAALIAEPSPGPGPSAAITATSAPVPPGLPSVVPPVAGHPPRMLTVPRPAVPPFDAADRTDAAAHAAADTGGPASVGSTDLNLWPDAPASPLPRNSEDVQRPEPGSGDEQQDVDVGTETPHPIDRPLEMRAGSIHAFVPPPGPLVPAKPAADTPDAVVASLSKAAPQAVAPEVGRPRALAETHGIPSSPVLPVQTGAASPQAAAKLPPLNDAAPTKAENRVGPEARIAADPRFLTRAPIVRHIGASEPEIPANRGTGETEVTAQRRNGPDISTSTANVAAPSRAMAPPDKTIKPPGSGDPVRAATALSGLLKSVEPVQILNSGPDTAPAIRSAPMTVAAPAMPPSLPILTSAPISGPALPTAGTAYLPPGIDAGPPPASVGSPTAAKPAPQAPPPVAPESAVPEIVVVASRPLMASQKMPAPAPTAVETVGQTSAEIDPEATTPASGHTAPHRYSVDTAPTPNSAPTLKIAVPMVPDGTDTAFDLLSEPEIGSEPGLESVNQGSPVLTSQRTLGVALAAPADLARGVGLQLAEAAARFPDRPVELTLSPEELGRVRLTFATTDAGMTMSILAERPETLDLLRRNIDQLAQDFRDLGFANVAFSFGRHQDGPPPGSPARPDPASADPASAGTAGQTPSADTTAIHRAARAADPSKGLDLRL